MKRLLYIGLRAPAALDEGSLHVPFIRIEPIICPHLQHLCCAYEDYTHILFTSQTAVHCFFEQCGSLPKSLPTLYSVGKATSRLLQTLGYSVAYCAREETAEGVLALLQETMSDFGSRSGSHATHLFWPHSAEARPLLEQYLATAPFRSTTAILYRTISQQPNPLPDLTAFDGVLFTSPSTVHAFFMCYTHVPPHLTCFAIGPITAACLRDYGRIAKSMAGCDTEGC